MKILLSILLILISAACACSQDESGVKEVKMASRELLARIQMIDGVPPGRYSMWRLEKRSDENSNTDILKIYDEIYLNSSGIYTRLLGSILSSIGAVSGNVTRMKFPNESLTIYLLVDGKIPVILTISSEKGIRFHFSENNVINEIEMDLILGYRDYVNATKKSVVDKGLELDEGVKNKPQEWWMLTSRAAISTHEVKGIGVLVIE